MSTRIHPSAPLHHISLIAWALAGALITPAARASPPEDGDAASLAPRLERLDAAPHELWATGSAADSAPSARYPLWIAVQAGVARLGTGERSFEAMLLASIPLERLADRAPRAGDRAPTIADGAAPRLKPPPREARSALQPPGGPAPSAAPRPEPPPAPAEPAAPLPLPVRITPDVARAAVGAALRRARLADPEARVDALASRARGAALLPELRLRVSRLVDESESLSPTEYDPGRVTAAGGVSLWLEARATWRLDRIVFADEEVALERLRRERAEAQGKLADRVLDLLFAWQRARAREADPGGTPEQRLAGTLEAIEAEASLDILTDGWFTRWRESQPPPPEHRPK